MVVLRAIGGFFARIGRWIRDTAWVQPLLIVGGIFAIIFSIPSITSWVQSWFVTGDEAISFYKNTGYKALDDGEQDGKNSSADKLLKFIFDTNEEERDYKQFGEKFFVTFVQEDCSTCKSVYKGWQSAIDSWGKDAGFKYVEKKQADGSYARDESKVAGELKVYTIFIDKENDDKKNYFWQLFDDVYSEQFGKLSSLRNPYSTDHSVDYSNIANSGSTDLSGGSVFTAPTTFLFDKNYNPGSQEGYSCDGKSIARFHISEILYDIPNKGSSGTSIEKARTIWDCWHHIGEFDNLADDIYRSR